MADSTGGVGGVGGSNGSGGSKSAEAAAAASNAANNAAKAAESIADSVVDAATGPTGVDVDAVGKALSGLQGQVPAGFAQSVQAAVEAQLSPVQAGQLQSAIDKATLSSVTPSLTTQLTRSPLADLAPPNPALQNSIYNAAGQLVDQCGNVQATVSMTRTDPLAESYRAAVKHIERSVSGPVSGIAYSVATIAGLDQKTRENIHALGTIADGFAEPLVNRVTEPDYTARVTPGNMSLSPR